jgi:hypothetical protein
MRKSQEGEKGMKKPQEREKMDKEATRGERRGMKKPQEGEKMDKEATRGREEG